MPASCSRRTSPNIKNRSVDERASRFTKSAKYCDKAALLREHVLVARELPMLWWYAASRRGHHMLDCPDGHMFACSFHQLGFQCGQHVPQHLLIHRLCQTVGNIVLRNHFSQPYFLVRDRVLQVSVLYTDVFFLPHPGRSALALAADESVSRMVWVS